MIGKSLGDYELIKELGHGGMGVVYLAEHKRLKNRYAIKILPEELKKDEQFIQRFHLEAGVMARLDHPNIVRVHYMGREGDTYYIVMEYIHDEDGETRTLEDVIKEKKELSEQYIKDILLQVCDGLIYAHNYRDDQIKDGVIHRDIKPGNIFIRNGREVKISDFGLARIVGTEYLSSRIQESISISIASRTLTGDKTSAEDAKKGEPPSPTLTGGETQTPKPKYQKTSTGALLGTYDFMSPEQKRGEDADKRSDIYALGILIYNFITGEKPEGRYSPIKKIKPVFSKIWDQVIDQCLSPKPQDRYQSVGKIRSEIEKIGKSIKKAIPVAIALALILGIMSFIFISQRKTPPSSTPTSISAKATVDKPTPAPEPSPSPSPSSSPLSPSPTPEPFNQSTNKPILQWKDGKKPPEEISWKESRRFSVEFFGSGGSGIKHYLTKLDKSGQWTECKDTRWNLVPLTEGAHTLQVKAVDHRDQESNILETTVEVINNPPEVKWVNVPEDRGIIRIPPWKIVEISAFDKDGEVVDRYFSWGTPEKGVKVSRNTFEIKDVTPGEQVLYAWVVDDGGKKSDMLDRRFVVTKNSPPQVMLKGPESPIKWQDCNAVKFEITASDADTQVSRIEWRFDTGKWEEIKSGEQTRPFDKAGDYTVEAKAIDSDGLESSLQSLKFRITGDNPPVLEAHLEKSEITEGETTRLIIDRAEDPDGGSVVLTYQISGSSWQKIDTGTLNLEPETRNQKSGNMNLELKATDEDQRETKKSFLLVIKTKDYEENFGNNVSLKMIWIEGGSFEMGSPDTEKERDSYEGPVHRVELDGFWLGETEVTQAQWKAMMGNNPSSFQGEDLPVEMVSWDDAMKFCEELSKKTGNKYTLPTEAQWEYACRSGTKTSFYTGETISTDQANYDGSYTYGIGVKGIYRKKTTPVKTFTPNPWGLYDMHGNVKEWCLDLYDSRFYGESEARKRNPFNYHGSSHVLRGGSWELDPRDVRSAHRGRGDPAGKTPYTGFRVAIRY